MSHTHSRVLRKRSAFTLIELLVVIAILAMMLALLLPAIQKVRESAAMTSCKNNMKQLSLACIHYQAENNHFPVGGMYNSSVSTASSATVNFGPNWAVLILPYIDQGGLYSAIELSVSNYMFNANEAGWRSISNTNLSMFNCPSDPNSRAPFVDSSGNLWARGNYGCNAGPAVYNNNYSLDPYGDFSLTTTAPVSARTVACNSGDFPASVQGFKMSGVMSANFGARPLDIPDGTTNTVLLDELRVGMTTADLRGTWAMGQAGASIQAGAGRSNSPYPNSDCGNGDNIQNCSIGVPTGTTSCTDPLIMTCGAAWGNEQVTARSAHANFGGVNTAMCDGSVQFFTNSVGESTWFLLHSASDGQSVVFPN